MKALMIIFLHLLLLRPCTSTKITIPVLMIDQDNVMSRITVIPNPLEKITAEFFTEVALLAEKKSKCVIIFLEDALSTEDLSTRNHGSPYSNLQRSLKEERVVYMPAVVGPYKALKQVFEPHDSKIFYLGAGEKLRVSEYHKYVYVYFKDVEDMSRAEKLRKHDLLIRDVYFTVRQLKAGPVVAFYTGKRNPIPLKHLQYFAPPRAPSHKQRGMLVATPEALFRLSDVLSSTTVARRSFEETPVVEFEMRTRRTLSTTMLVTDFHLQFNFEFHKDKWNLANVAMLEAGEEVGRTETHIKAPWKRSYYCAEPITIFNMRDGSSITISEYQIEPLAPSRRQEDPAPPAGAPDGPPSSKPKKPGMCEFSTAINCGPYFNSAILSGVFVFLIFTVIAFWGVIMLLSCPTNDRFDDPNQKPLVIAQEHTGHH